MNIDMAALHAIEVDRGISVNELVETIKSALLTAYRHTQGHQNEARIEIDRKTGVVQVMAREVDEDGNVISEWDDTPWQGAVVPWSPPRVSAASPRPPHVR